MDDDEKMIELLAEEDVLFEPIRNWGGNQPVAAILDLRVEFRRYGLRYRVGGANADRISGHHDANRWEQDGLVKFSRTRGKRSHWRLTTPEYWRLRWLCLLTGEDELIVGMTRILEHEAAGYVYHRSRLVPENALCGDHYDKGGILHVEEILLGGLVHGLLESASDSDGRVYYGLTAAGKNYLDSWPGPTFSPPDYDAGKADAAGDAYIVATVAARRALASAKSDTGNLAIPLSCGYIPVPVPDCTPILDEDEDEAVNATV